MTSTPADVFHYKLKLFITGSTPRSNAAIKNLQEICESRLKGQYELEVIDLYLHPEAARENQISAAPTLLKILPTPIRRVIGNLADMDKVLAGLDLDLFETAPPGAES